MSYIIVELLCSKLINVFDLGGKFDFSLEYYIYLHYLWHRLTSLINLLWCKAVGLFPISSVDFFLLYVPYASYPRSTEFLLSQTPLFLLIKKPIMWMIMEENLFFYIKPVWSIERRVCNQLEMKNIFKNYS